MPLMDPGDGPSDADPPAVPVAVNELGERDLDRELERLLADHVVIGAVPDTKERLERLADELFTLVRENFALPLFIKTTNSNPLAFV